MVPCGVWLQLGRVLAPGKEGCSLFMADHPLSSNSFGAPGTITPLVDLWIEKQQLPGYMRP